MAMQPHTKDGVQGEASVSSGNQTDQGTTTVFQLRLQPIRCHVSQNYRSLQAVLFCFF